MTDRERVDPSEKAFHPLAKRNLESGLYKCKLATWPIRVEKNPVRLNASWNGLHTRFSARAKIFWFFERFLCLFAKKRFEKPRETARRPLFDGTHHASTALHARSASARSPGPPPCPPRTRSTHRVSRRTQPPVSDPRPRAVELHRASDATL